ncbi:MAG: LemA family protein [Planctomycetaceae bacterium]
MPPEHLPWVILCGGLLICLIWLLGTYNGLVRMRQHVKESWADIDVQLKRRYDLIPNLVETVKGYAKHERELFERVVQLRSRASANHGPVASQEADERPLVAALRQVLALAEGYPDLKANRGFLALQEELADTEDRIAAARRFFNANVRDYASRRESFPSSLVANLFRFGPLAYWSVEEATHRARPDVAV